MSDLKLRTVSIRNWETIRNAELEFPDKGLVLVLGRNTASEGKLESVGSGKTALGEALCRGLLGTRGRYAELGHYSSDAAGNKDMYVKIGTELKRKPFTVEFGYRCKELGSVAGEGLRFTHGELSAVERSKVRETRDELTSVLGVSSELAAWTVFIDGDKVRFTNQSERNAVNLLMAALRQPSWESYQKRAQGVMNDAKAKLENAKGVHTSTTDDIGDCAEKLRQAGEDVQEESAALAEKVKEFKTNEANVNEKLTAQEADLETVQERQKAIKRQLKKLEEQSAAQFSDLELKKAALRTKGSELGLKRTKLVETRSTLRSAWQTANATLSSMESEPENCPTCNKKWDKTHSAEEIARQKTLVQEAKDKFDDKTAAITDVDGLIEANNEAIGDIEHKITALRTPAENRKLSQEYERNEEKIETMTTEVTDLKLELQQIKQGPDRSHLRRLQTIQEERKRALTAAQDNLETAAQTLVETEALVKVTSYWYEAFGPTGIPNMILGEAIKPLNEIARRISLLMTGGTIAITYATSRELASGASSSELVIKVANRLGSRRAEGSSKGEAGLTNLIIAETLSEVGSVSGRIGFRWYDEVLNSQDQTVRRNVMSYLRDLANQLGILIFVVDHHQESASYADYILVAEKTTKGTSLTWG